MTPLRLVHNANSLISLSFTTFLSDDRIIHTQTQKMKSPMNVKSQNRQQYESTFHKNTASTKKSGKGTARQRERERVCIVVHTVIINNMIFIKKLKKNKKKLCKQPTTA